MDWQQSLRDALTADARPSHEIAGAVGIHPVSVRRFKAGQGIDLETARRLAAVLGYDLSVSLKKKRKEKA